MHLHIAAALGSGLLVTSTALSSLGDGSWLTVTVPVPLGVVLAALGLILVPTGDLISLVAKWLAHFEPPDRTQSDHDSQRHRPQNRSPPPADDHRHAENAPPADTPPDQ